MKKIKASELILNSDNSVYHLNLLPGDVAKDIITVGDPERAKMIARRFDSVNLKKSKREFLTITGELNGKPLTVISTGIGTDNIDIVFTELDALFNIDIKKRIVKKKISKLNFYRIGTSGSIHKKVPVDSFLISKAAFGLDGLAHFYDFKSDSKSLKIFNSISSFPKTICPYFIEGSQKLIKKFRSNEFLEGITLTANGFYNPQGRVIRLNSKMAEKLKGIQSQKIKKSMLSNLEMETAGIYLLSNLFGHEAISINAILANRTNGEFSSNPKKQIKTLIDKSLEIICT